MDDAKNKADDAVRNAGQAFDDAKQSTGHTFDDAKAKAAQASQSMSNAADDGLNRADDAANKTSTDWDDKAVDAIKGFKERIDGDDQ